MRKRSKNKQYFTQIHEDAILEYISCADNDKRNEIYKETIQPVFLEMINKIVFTYKFTTLPNINNLKNECEI